MGADRKEEVVTLLGRRGLLVVVSLMAFVPTPALVAAWTTCSDRPAASHDAADALTFPRSVVTAQDKIDWLTAEAEVAAQAVDAETEKPLPQQREDLYRAALACGADLSRLIKTVAGRFPRLEARVNETLTKARGGLERIENARLTIGMSGEQVRQIRGEPSSISETMTAVGARQQWRYGATMLLFDNGKLVEIRQMLSD